MVTALIFQVFTFLFVDADVTDAETAENNIDMESSTSARQEERHDVKLYFHRDGSMDTEPPTSQVANTEFLRDNSGLEFALNPALKSDLVVEGYQGSTALWMDISMSNNVPGGSDADITINIKDDSVTIATKTFTIPTLSTRDVFIVPLVGGVKEYTFLQNSVIRVNITASISGVNPVRITSDSNTAHGFLYLTCNQIVSTSLGAFHSDNKAGDFAPNEPDDRVISFQGEINDGFGGYDIEMIELNSPDLSVFPTNARATIWLDANVAKYYYNWTYPYKISPGNYKVVATIYDNTALTESDPYTFSDEASFTFSTFGVHLHIVEPDKSAEKGKSISFELKVTNIGGSSDSIKMQASSSLGWSSSFDVTPVPVAPNATEPVKLTVNVPTTAQDGQQDTITITATSNGNSAKYDSVTALARAQATTGFTFELLGGGAKNIEAGETANYRMKLMNIGQKTEKFSVVIDDKPGTGWEVTLEGGDDSTSTKFEHKEAELGSNGQIIFYLNVSSTNPSTLTQIVSVKAYPTSDISNQKTLTTTTTFITESGILLSHDNKVKTSEVVDPKLDDITFETVEFSITVKNIGPELSLEFELMLPSESLDDWIGSKPSSITLDENDEDDVKFTVTPPKSAKAKNYEITFRAISTDDSSINAQTTGTVKVEQFYRLAVDVEKDKNVDGAGRKVDYAISITNNGNGDDLVTVILTNDWDYSIETTGILPNVIGDTVQFLLGYGESTKFILALTSPKDAKNGDEGNTKIVVRSFEFTQKNKYTYMEFDITSTVKKSTSDAFMDAIAELWILIVLVIAVIIIAVFIKVKLKEKEKRE